MISIMSIALLFAPASMRRVQKGGTRAGCNRPLTRRLWHQAASSHEGRGKSIAFLLTLGQAHDSPSFEALMEAGKVKRPSGRIKYQSKQVVCDRAYGRKANRAYFKRLGIRSTFFWKSNQQRRGPFNKAI